jgi:hypothetical protein
VVVSSESAEGRRGEVVVQRRVPGWFSSPILWYRSDQSTVFMFTKTRTLPITKGGVKPRKAEAYVGGIPPSDPRRYLRFDPSNRMALSREYFARIPRRKIPGVPGKLAGDLPGRGG